MSLTGVTRRPRPQPRDRRGIALIMVMLVVSTLMIIGILFSGSVTAEYRAAVYYRQAVQSEQYCVAGLHRAMGELMYDVWGVNEDRPFESARYNSSCITPPVDNLLPLHDAAYYDGSTGSLQPIVRQTGYWNGESWVVWAGQDHPGKFAATGDAEVDGNPWNMDPRQTTREEMIGGAQRYLSFGAGTVAVTSGSKVVTGTGTNFDTGWGAWTYIYIDRIGSVRLNAAPSSATQLTIETASSIDATGLGYAYYGVAGLAGAGAVPGGPQTLASFTTADVGYPANPRWVNPEAFVSYYNSGPFVYGGVDLNGDGMIDGADKALRNWALWKLKCDAFLPEGMDNNDAFESQMHANSRLRFAAANVTRVGSKDTGYEFLSPLIVGDSFYQVFRFDPIYTMYDRISGEPAGAADLAQNSNTAGYRYPYSRTHLGKDSAVALANDIAGGLVNINTVNNNYNSEQWTDTPASGDGPENLSWYHINEGKWIDCYDPLNADKRFGRYSVTVMPDCATWNAAALHSGVPDVHIPTYSAPVTSTTGTIVAAGGMMTAIKSGFKPQSGDSAGASLLRSVAVCYAPIRPEPLPVNWSNQGTDSGATYFCPDGFPDTNGVQDRNIQCDRTRAPEIVGGHGGTAWDQTTGARSAIFNYLMWLGPYDSRSEFATHLRKAGLCIPYPSYSGYPNHTGTTPDLRRCMETDMNVRDSDLTKIARDAQLIAAQTTVHGYYYTLDRFWDRDLLFMGANAGTSGSATDARVSTAQSTAATPVDWTAAQATAGQKTRTTLLRDLSGLECFGGYRTRDGKYKLLDYLFEGDTPPGEYTTFLAGSGAANDASAPTAYGRSAVYGGAGDIADPTTWTNQRITSRREKALATMLSRIASSQRTAGITAACANGHLLHSPQLNPFYKPVWNAGAGTLSKSLRTSAADPCYDELGAGCPVCGGKLFLAPIYEVAVNEVGRFYGRFRNAERPARTAWSMKAGGDPGKKPMRNFIEILVTGRYDDFGATDCLVRFDQTVLSGTEVRTSPTILSDPVTCKPYFTHGLEYDVYWRKPSTDSQAMDPEPIFRGLNQKGGGAGPTQYPNLHVLVYDDNDNGGRWHDVTWGVDNNYVAYDYHYNTIRTMVPDPQGFGKVFFTDDTDPTAANWTTTSLRCDNYYAMADPDPAHLQTNANASVSLYRKMPVRWYGGNRKDTWYMQYSSTPNIYTGDPHAGTPGEIYNRRGLGFDELMRLENKRYCYQYYHDYLYGGDTAWNAAPIKTYVGSRVSDTEWPAFRYKDPGQFAVISFDERFNGSKVALVFGSQHQDMPNYGSYRLASYVELTDSAGAPQRIGDTCIDAVGGTPAVCDPSRPNDAGAATLYSWQARNPRDTRGNADGYMLWDLLPMTLCGEVVAGANDPLSDTVGFDPWWITNYGAGVTWWCAGDDGFTTRADPQGWPAGYYDIAHMNDTPAVCNNRNTNMWNMNVPVKRPTFDGTTARSKDAMEGIHESIIRTMFDHCNVYASWRTPQAKDNTVSIPTGIGRQVSDAEARDPAKATYAGRQYWLAGTWHDGVPNGGAGTTDLKKKWAGYSWSSWYKVYEVTDLCQSLLWSTVDTDEDVDLFDADQDGLRDEKASSSISYLWSEGGIAKTVSAVRGHFIGELRQINKLNLNEMWYPPTFSGVKWNQSYTSFGRKPLKGFHAPSDEMARHYVSDPGYNLRIRPWDLDNDGSLESNSIDGSYYYRMDPSHCGSSPVYTLYVTGNALDEQGEPLAEMRLRATVERTWDGRCNVLEFCWLTKDRGFMDE